jgi:hypothetical protein
VLQQGVLLLRRPWQERCRRAAVLNERRGLRLRRHLQLLTERVCFLEVGQEDRRHCRGLRVAQYCQLIFGEEARNRDSNKQKEGIREKEKDKC